MFAMGASMPEPEYYFPLEGAVDICVYVLTRNAGKGNDRNALCERMQSAFDPGSMRKDDLSGRDEVDGFQPVFLAVHGRTDQVEFVILD